MTTNKAPTHDPDESALFRVVAGLVAVALAIGARSYALGDSPLWLDEAYSANFARLPFAEMVGKLARESTPPLYYVLLRVWTAIFGVSEAAQRSLSAALSTAQLVALVYFASRHFGRRTAVLLFVLACFLPIDVYYAHEARMYALLALLATLLLVSAARALEHPSTAALLAAGLASLLALWTHNVALWLVAGVNVGFLLSCRERQARLHWCGVQGLAALLYLPWLRVLLGQLRSQSDVLQWFVPFWNAASPLGHLVGSFGSFALGPFPPYVALSAQVPFPQVIAVAAIAGAAFGVLRMPASRELRMAAIALATALILSLGYSLWVQPAHIPGRTDQALRPLFLLLLAAGLGALRPKWIGNGVAALFAVAALATIVPSYAEPTRRESVGWLDLLRKDVRPGDVVVSTGLSYSEAKYYLARDAADVELVSFPLRLSGHPGYVSYAELRKDPEALRDDTLQIAGRLEEALSRGARGFVLLVPPGDVNGTMVNVLKARLELAPKTLGGSPLSRLRTPVRVLVFDRRTP